MLIFFIHTILFPDGSFSRQFFFQMILYPDDSLSTQFIFQTVLYSGGSFFQQGNTEKNGILLNSLCGKNVVF